MPHFFCNEVTGENIIINGEDAKHISRALRMKTGERLYVATPNRMKYECEIETIVENSVSLKIISCCENINEPTVLLTLYQAIPKAEKMELIIQKVVELGIAKIVPVLSKRCVSRPDKKSMDKKIIRWQKIAEEAAKQSGRGIIPHVGALLTFDEAVSALSRHECPLIFYEGGGNTMADIVKSGIQDVGMLIGAEGGFEDGEVTLAAAHGINVMTLGKLILRCETAPIAASAIIMHITGQM